MSHGRTHREHEVDQERLVGTMGRRDEGIGGGRDGALAAAGVMVCGEFNRGRMRPRSADIKGRAPGVWITKGRSPGRRRLGGPAESAAGARETEGSGTGKRKPDGSAHAAVTQQGRGERVGADG